MKKVIITTAIVLGLGMTSFADPNGGGVFGRGESTNRSDGNSTTLFAPRLPSHGQDNNQPAPLGSGIAMLAAFGVGYLMSKKHREE